MHNACYRSRWIFDVNGFVSSHGMDDASQWHAFAQDVKRWLAAPQSVMHWWSQDPAVLREAVDRVMSSVRQTSPTQSPLLFTQEDFVPLLQKLNVLMAATQDPAAQKTVSGGRVWLIERADTLGDEHLDVLRRICSHYPELGIHLALFSLGPLAPAAIEGIPLAEIQPGLPAYEGLDMTVPKGKPAWQRWSLSLVVLAVLAEVVWLLSGHDFKVSAAAPSVAALQPQAVASVPAPPPTPVPDLPVAAKPAPVLSVPAASVPVAPAPAAKTVPSPAPSVQTAAAAPASAPVVAAGSSASARWVQGLPPESRVVVHLQSASLREAEAFKQMNQPLLANARILQTQETDGRKPRYLVASGPFRSEERAGNYIQRLEWRAEARSITRESLLGQVVR